MAGTDKGAPARRRWRTVDGIVLLDKPAGLSSNHALQRVRRALQAEKAGHAGTLDPMATGMLPLCFGQATKACGALLGKRKAYRATLRLGAATDTGDADGQVVAECAVPEFTEADLERVFDQLRGDRLQVPPMYSALKRDGRPLYELARRGEVVDRAARPIRIEELSLVERGEREVTFDVVCSKGTYIRVLGEELAMGLGSVGHLAALRRLWVEPFEADRMVTMDEVESAAAQGSALPASLLPVDYAFRDIPAVHLDATSSLHLCQGRTLAPPPALPESPLWRAYDPERTFLGLIEAAPDGRLRVHRLFVPGAGTGNGEKI